MNTFPYTASQFASLLLQEADRVKQAIDLTQSQGEFTFWTQAMKRWLAAKAREHNLRAIYTDQQGMSEFLLDLIWWQDGPGGSAVLACEMEWGNTRDPRRNPGRVAEDFDKLLSFKAPFKLMLFDSYGDVTTQSNVILELDRYLREFGDHRLGEQYLVIDMSPLKNIWRCSVSRDGEDCTLKLSPLALP